MPLQPGDTVDRYVIEGPIGAGGMGEVYRARDERLQRRVALKVLREEPDGGTAPSVGSKPSASRGATRMLREARAAAALDHPNVVAVFDVGQIDVPGPLQGTTYLAMELIKGVSLRSYVGEARVPMAERVRWLVDVARALFAAHQEGIVHRDIKPENVMVREDGHVKVLDFGIARATRGRADPEFATEQAPMHATTGSLAMGTPMYMAPEQLRAEVLDGRADQFGWGVMAYELLSGRLPWSAERGPTALLAQVLTETPRRLDEVAADVPVTVANVVMRALSKAPGERFPTMQALLAELGADTGSRVTAPPPLANVVSPRLTTDPLAATQLAPTPATGGRPDTASHLTPPASSNPTPRVGAPPGESTKRRASRAGLAAALALIVVVGGIAWRAVRAKPAVATQATSSSAALATPGCANNQACIDAHGGAPWICREDHTCVALESEDCKILAQPGDVANDSTVWIGAVYPMSGEDAREYADEVRTVDLARRDFAEALAPVHDAVHIGVVACDAQIDSGRAARHLADDVRVPASLLVARERDEAVVDDIFTPKGVLTMLPLDASATVAATPPGSRGRLVWRSVYGPDSIARATSALIEQYLEPRLRSERPGLPTRVAMLRGKVLVERELVDVVLREIRVNGAPLSEQPDDFLELPVSEDDAWCAHAQEQLVRFAPAVVLVTRVEEQTKCGVASFDAHWPGALPRPVYLYPTRLPRQTLEYARQKSERRARILGVDERDAPIASNRVATRFEEVFGQPVEEGVRSTTYDGMYALAYGVYAADRRRPSGADVAGGLARLRSGNVIDVGSLGIREGYGTLKHGGSFDLEGVAGHLELDPQTGESSFDISVLCAGLDPATHEPTNLDTGLWYDAREKRMRGTLKCP